METVAIDHGQMPKIVVVNPYSTATNNIGQIIGQMYNGPQYRYH